MFEVQGVTMSWKRSLIILVGVQVLAMMAMGLFVPFLSLYLEDLGVVDQAEQRWWAGILRGASVFCSALLGVVWGTLSDRFGRKLMVPKTSIQRITKLEAKARFYLAKYSVPFGSVQAFFVPIKLLPTVLAQLQTLKDDFEKEVDYFIERFGESKEEVRTKHPEFWKKCLESTYPLDPKNLRSKFHFQWTVFQIGGISSITSMSDTDAVLLKDELEKTTKDFVGEYVETMRHKTMEFCDLVAARVNREPLDGEKEAKRITPRSLAMFRKSVETFKTMNIFGDNKIESLLHGLGEKFLGSTVTPSDLEASSMKTSLVSALDAIKKEISTDNDSEFISGAKRRITL